MRCAKATSLLQAYLDNELTASQEAQLNHHLKGCALCRMQLSAFKQTGEAMSLWKDKETRRDLVSPVMQKLRYEQEAPSAFQHFIAVLVANKRKILAVGANIVVFLLLLFNIPLFLKNPGINIGDTGSIPTPKISNARPEPIIIPSYDLVDMATSLNGAVDDYNLKPVERDMIVDNLINDANDISNGAIQIPPTTGQVKYRKVQLIYVRGSKDKPVVQRVIFTQQIRYEKTQ